MGKKTSGYVAGIGCIFGFVLLLLLAINNEWNTTGQLLWGFTVVFGGLSVGCFWKPETFGNAVSKYFEQVSESKGRSDANNTQTQTKSSGVQVMAQDNAHVTVNVDAEKKKGAENVLEDKKTNKRPQNSKAVENESGNILDLVDARKIALLCQAPRATEYLRQQYDYWQSQSDFVVLGGYSFDDYMKLLEKEGFLMYQAGKWKVSQEALDYIAKYHGF
jgi:hypothetical protein